MAIFSPVGTPPGEGIPGTPEVGSISPALDLLTKDINPQAREILNAQNPMSQFKEVEPNLVDAGGAKKIDMNARERLGGFRDPMSQFKEVSGLTLPGFTEADDLDVKTVEQLDLDRDNFRPAEYFTNNPDVAKDPKRLAKLLEVVRRRDAEGLIAKRVAEAAIKNTPGTVSDIAGGIKRFGERAVDVVVQPTVNVILGTLTGDLFDDQKRAALFSETRKTLKKGTAEVAAGAESATVGLVDLARTADQKISQGAITSFDDLPRTRVSRPEPIPAKPKTDQELLAQLSDDASFRQVADAAMRGEGEAAKVAGLDKETLAKEGIELDENAIRQLSLVDPVTMVATGGAFKLVGIGGKVLATAKTLEGAQKFADKLAKVAKFSAGKSVQGIGKATTFVGERLQGSGRSAALITGIGAATQGSGAFESLAIAAATKAIGPVVRKGGGFLEHAGKAIAGEVPVSANFQKVLDYAKPIIGGAETVTRGAFSGLAAGAPFAVAAQDDETAGTLFGAGAALGAAGGAGAGAFRVVQRGASRRYFGENRPVLEDVPSPGYGDAPSDTLHDAQMQKLSAQDASEVNNFREVLRPLGKKILAVDKTTFRQKVSEARPGVTPEQLDVFENHSAFFDSADTVYLNSDATGLLHDAGHLFDSLLSPEQRTELRTAVTDTFGQKSIEDFKATYERRVGSKISDSAALDEFIAEQFAALFNNVPVTEMSAPKGLLTKFVDTIAEGAEALGIDLTAGATTPNIGAPVSVGIRKLFQNAAGDVTRRSIEAKTAAPTNVTPFPGEPTPPAAPSTPTPPVTPPGNVVPLPGVSSRNIRVGPENVAAFKQSASPDVRAAADARARETGVDYARTEAKKEDGSPTSRVIESISDSMESGRPVVQIEHLGITSASTPEAPLGRTPRRGEQAGGYAALEAAQLDVRQNAPPEIVSQYSKNFVPTRWDAQGGSPTLIAMSLDKVIANMMKLAADPKAKDLIPYSIENGKYTPDGWRQVVADAQAYAENQSNGRRGDGGRLEVPEAGLSIPAENPAYTPQPLSPERANFQNLVQGLAPPLTARSQKGVTPGNVKGQILAEANLRPTETPASITPARAGKQAFAEFPGRTVQEVNPLRNEMERRGVKTRELIEVTERIRAKDIVSSVARPDVNYKAPVTDVIRGGFQPAPTEFRQKSLGGRTVEEFSKYVLDAPVEEWRAAVGNMTGGQTGGSWNLGLGLKDRGDLAVLKKYQEASSAKSVALMDEIKAMGAANAPESLFTEMQVAGTKAMFFREALEAAQGIGSAGAAFAKDRMGFSVAKPPFPVVEGGANFLPAEQLEIGTAESRPPELRVLPAAPGGRPPTEPPVLRPPPVAAGFLPAEELQPEETPEVRVLPAAPGGRPPTEPPGLRPPPMAAGFQPQDENNPARTGLEFKKFFSDVAAGKFGKSEVPFTPLQDLSDVAAVETERMKHWGNFENHIQRSIPMIHEEKTRLADGIIKTFGEKGARVLDIGSSEGDFGKAISALSDGKIETVSLDPNPQMAADFKTISTVKGATHTEDAFLNGFQDGEKTYRAHNPETPYDLINEAVTFQFIDPNRDAQIAEVKRLLTPDGVFTTAEKFRTADWEKNEAKKDRDYKNKYFTKDELSEKEKRVGFQQSKEEEKAVGMVDNMVPDTSFEEVLKKHFNHVAQYWDSGNFKGYAASDNPEVLARLVGNIGDLNSEFSTVKTPRPVTESAGFQPRTESGRKLEKRGYKVVPKGEFGMREVAITKDGEPVANIDSVQRSLKVAEIAMVTKTKDAPKGVGEVLYRELASQLQEDGVTEVVGNVISPQPLAIRKKVFGEFKSIKLNDEPASFEEAIAAAERVQNRTENEIASIEPINTISEASRFLPVEPTSEFTKDLIEKNGWSLGVTRNRGTFVLTLRDGEKEVAQLMTTIDRGTPSFAEIDTIETLPEYRGKGAAESLMREAANLLKSNGVKRVGGNFMTQAPMNLMKKIFKDFESLGDDIADFPIEEARTRLPEQPAPGRLKSAASERTGKVYGVSNLGDLGTSFLPKVKRDAQGRPLKKNGEIDYPRWAAEGAALRRKQEAEPIEEPIQQGRISAEAKTPTGWILPDKTFVPLDTAFHEGFLAENAKDLNKRFGTALSETPSVGDRLDALNAGFVRFRYDARSGNLLIEANAGKWPKLKPTVKRRLQDNEDRITGFTLSLLNDKALQVDSVTVPRMQELSGPQKLNAIDEAVDSLRVPAQ